MENPKRRVVRMAAEPGRRLSTAQEVHRLVHPVFMGLDREHLWRVDLGSRNGLLGAELVSIGTVDYAPCHPREVFAGAMANRASRIILIHNHRSGDLTPSPTDRAAIERLELCGLILGIEVADHLIVDGDRFFSLKESGPMVGATHALGLEPRRNPAILYAPGQRRRLVVPATISPRPARSPKRLPSGSRQSTVDWEGAA